MLCRWTAALLVQLLRTICEVAIAPTRCCLLLKQQHSLPHHVVACCLTEIPLDAGRMQ